MGPPIVHTIVHTKCTQLCTPAHLLVHTSAHRRHWPPIMHSTHFIPFCAPLNLDLVYDPSQFRPIKKLYAQINKHQKVGLPLSKTSASNLKLSFFFSPFNSLFIGSNSDHWLALSV